jgi:hypothetical protein
MYAKHDEQEKTGSGAILVTWLFVMVRICRHETCVVWVERYSGPRFQGSGLSCTLS